MDVSSTSSSLGNAGREEDIETMNNAGTMYLSNSQFDRIASALDKIGLAVTRIAESQLLQLPQLPPQLRSQQRREGEDTRRLDQILKRLDQVRQALITVEMLPFDKHTKPTIDFSDASLDPEFLAVWCRTANRYDYCKALCDLVAKLRAEETEERGFLREMARHSS
ncbi:hypothetical protein BGX27_009781 [Mortierella sp. AM989]|nr:hypothetical protein BGX27_009781 [Mortierella sp. AM989]